MEDLKKGKWYWVRYSQTDDWFPAMYDPTAAGGWTNTDTWQDFYKEVTDWRKIEMP